MSLNIKLLFPFLLLILSCSSLKKLTNENSFDNSKCSLNSVFFEIKPNNFKLFDDIILNHLYSNSNLDVIYLYNKGGSPNKSYIKRWEINSNTLNFFSKKNDSIISKKILYDESYQFIFEKELKSYIQECRYDSSNNSYLISIKNEGRFIYRYFSVGENYGSLSNEGKDTLKKVIKLINNLNMVNNELN